MGRFLELCRPDQKVDSLADIDLKALMEQGIDTLMLDLDNTLLPWRSSVLPESSKQWIRDAREMGLKLCIVSNTHNPSRLANISLDIGVPAFHRALKPRRRGFARAAREIGSQPEHTAVVGDQILTDIIGGNRSGMFTILVKPMHSYEFVGTKLSRAVERVILRLLRGKDSQGTIAGANQSEGQDSK